jgi:hypothetical protein
MMSVCPVTDIRTVTGQLQLVNVETKEICKIPYKDIIIFSMTS